MTRFQDQIVLVTGAGAGIGRALALAFAREGARVGVNDVQGEAAAAVVRDIEAAGGAALAVVADVSQDAEVAGMFDRLEGTWGPVTVLVNNAALTSDQRHFLEADAAWWDRLIAVNLRSVFLCSHRAAEHMAARGSGVILTVSSGGATRAHRGFSAYDAAKGGVEALTRAMALDLAPYGVRVNGITPGFINTYGLEGEDLARRAATVPLGRYGEAGDLAGAALFLASPEASYVTGQFIVVDGGVLVQQRSANVDTFGLERFPTR